MLMKIVWKTLLNNKEFKYTYMYDEQYIYLIVINKELYSSA